MILHVNWSSSICFDGRKMEHLYLFRLITNETALSIPKHLKWSSSICSDRNEMKLLYLFHPYINQALWFSSQNVSTYTQLGSLRDCIVDAFAKAKKYNFIVSKIDLSSKSDFPCRHVLWNTWWIPITNSLILFIICSILRMKFTLIGQMFTTFWFSVDMNSLGHEHKSLNSCAHFFL